MHAKKARHSIQDLGEKLTKNKEENIKIMRRVWKRTADTYNDRSFNKGRYCIEKDGTFFVVSD